MAQIKVVEPGQTDPLADQDTSVTHTLKEHGYLTGSEWYDRFVKEMDSVHPYPIAAFIGAETYNQIDIDKAAKRASGIEAQS